MKEKIKIVNLLFLAIIGINFVTAQQLSTRFGINTKAWYFGEKAGIKFTPNGPVSIQDNIAGLGSSNNTSINLLYDDSTDTVQCYSTGLCFYDQMTSQIFQSYPIGFPIICDSSGTSGSFSTIIPSFSDSTLFYIFSIISYTNYDCYLNWAGIQFNGQNFNLISEDSMFVSNYLQHDFGVIRHGNGKDFWLLFHRHGSSTTTNEYMSALFSDGTITDTIIQHIGTPVFSTASIQFNHRGDKVAILNNYPNQTTVSELYDFDRCTGLLSNLDTIRVHQAGTSSFLTGVFSPNDSLFYVSSWDTLFQYQVYAPNILTSAVIIYTADSDATLARWFGEMELGPDKKLYISIFNGAWANHTDSIVGYLDVIHYPDLVGTACTYQPYAVYLDGNRAMGILPYIYEYDKGPLVNSPCDTIYTTTSLSEQSTKPKITLAPNPAQTQATFTWSGMQEGIFVLQDMLGRMILQNEITANSGLIKLDFSALPKGIYLWQVQSVEYSKNGKLVVE
jgi:hypothetical protein